MNFSVTTLLCKAKKVGHSRDRFGMDLVFKEAAEEHFSSIGLFMEVYKSGCSFSEFLRD